ncbi:MAG: transcriptional regulator [Planctomycetes bacterium]|nr:transcriptional regulator [Planctomycetota bacterium]
MQRKELKSKTSVGSRIIHRLEEFTEALENQEAIPQQFTCRHFALDLRPTQYTPELVRETRSLLNLSQALFASFLGTSTNAVRAWEQGVNQPNEMACRFMDEIRHDPKRFQARLKKLATRKSPVYR